MSTVEFAELPMAEALLPLHFLFGEFGGSHKFLSIVNCFFLCTGDRMVNFHTFGQICTLELIFEGKSFDRTHPLDWCRPSNSTDRIICRLCWIQIIVVLPQDIENETLRQFYDN